MTNSQCHGLAIVGNDTEVGKTTIACQLIDLLRHRGVKVGAFKPAASGYSDDDPASDVQRLLSATGGAYSLDEVCPYRFVEPVAPIVAADRQGTQLSDQLIDDCLLRWRANCDLLVLETAGGLMSPLTLKRSNLGFCMTTGFNSIVVIENRLGAINQANLVCHALLSHSQPIAAIVFNQTKDQSHNTALLRSNVQLFMGQFQNNFACPAPPCVSVAFGQKLDAKFLELIGI